MIVFQDEQHNINMVNCSIIVLGKYIQEIYSRNCNLSETATKLNWKYF